jgi:hypothetical protein
VQRSDGEQAAETPAGDQQEISAVHRSDSVSYNLLSVYYVTTVCGCVTPCLTGLYSAVFDTSPPYL